MFGFIPTGTNAIIQEYIGWTPASSPTSQLIPYTLPLGKSMVNIIAIGSGGAGGGGGNSTGTGGGGGGGSGTVSSILFPRHLLSDTIIIQCCSGGLASTTRQTAGGAGSFTRVYIQTPQNTIDIKTCIISAPGGGGGGASSSTTGGAAGAAGASESTTNMLYGATIGMYSFAGGGPGVVGGASGANGSNITVAPPRGITSGGAGGAGKGTTTISAFNGGSIIKNGTTIVAGGTGSIGSAAGSGLSLSSYSQLLIPMFFGGSGGGSTDNTAAAGNGGNGGIGCGGGGGGSSVGTAGFGGNGGPGYILIASF